MVLDPAGAATAGAPGGRAGIFELELAQDSAGSRLPSLCRRGETKGQEPDDSPVFGNHSHIPAGW